MPLPYYVSPEQMMKDKAEYARKGISRGRSLVTLEYGEGILLVAGVIVVVLNVCVDACYAYLDPRLRQG